MKASTRLFFLLFLVFVTINTLAQNGVEGKKSIYLQSGDSGIKRTTLQTFGSINSYGMIDNQLMSTGEPVPGAEVYIELEPDDEPIANVITNENGEFYFETAGIPNFPNQGTFILNITPSKDFSKSKKKSIKKEKIIVEFIKPKGGVFKFILFWMPEVDPDKAQNKGAFAVSGKNST